MTDLLTILARSAMAFAATNLDDIVILMLFFSQVGVVLRKRHIVAGQYIGFAGLVALSLPGFFGSLLFPRPWIGLLEVVPIVIGLSQLLSVVVDEESGEDTGEVLLAPTSGGSRACFKTFWHNGSSTRELLSCDDSSTSASPSSG